MDMAIPVPWPKPVKYAEEECPQERTCVLTSCLIREDSEEVFICHKHIRIQLVRSQSKGCHDHGIAPLEQRGLRARSADDRHIVLLKIFLIEVFYFLKINLHQLKVQFLSYFQSDIKLPPPPFFTICADNSANKQSQHMSRRNQSLD